MGQISDAILDGVFCKICGVYIGDAIGYERSCARCRKNCDHEWEPCKDINICIICGMTEEDG